jgi:hypothetical protein
MFRPSVGPRAASRPARADDYDVTVLGLLVVVLLLLVVGGGGFVVWMMRTTAQQRAMAVEAEMAAREEAEAARREAEVARQQAGQGAALPRPHPGPRDPQAERQKTGPTLERAVSLCEQGKVGEGLLWMVRGLETVADDAEAEQALRTHLAAWGQPQPEPRVVLRPQGAVTALALSPDRKTLATGGADGTVRAWEADSGQARDRLLELPGPVTALVYTADGQRLRAGNASGKFLEVATADGKLLGEPSEPREPVAPPPPKSPAPRPILASRADGAVLLLVQADGAARLWDAVLRQPIGRPLRPESKFQSAAFSPDGTSLLTADKDGTVRLWPVPRPVKGDVGRLTLWAQATAGAELDAAGTLHPLAPAARDERRQRLQQAGGPPPP